MLIELLDPKNDYVFKRIFGHIGNENITKQMLSTILKTKINKISLEETPILEQDLVEDKVGIIDVHAKIEETIDVDIEMQVVSKSNIEKRLLFYWSKLYTKNINKGQDYNSLCKTIVILIADFELDKLTHIPKFHTKWQIREEEYKNVILTELLGICIIELPKINKIQQENANEIRAWLIFLENPEQMEMEGMSKENKEAKDVLKEISSDERERYLADLRLKYIMDQKAIEEYGYDHGQEEGKKLRHTTAERNSEHKK